MCVELFHKDNIIALNIVHLSAKIALFLVQIGIPLSLTLRDLCDGYGINVTLRMR